MTGAVALAAECDVLVDKVSTLTRELEIKTAALEILAADLTAAHVTIDRLQDALTEAGAEQMRLIDMVTDRDRTIALIEGSVQRLFDALQEASNRPAAS